MKCKIRYELPIYSQALEGDPIIEYDNMDIKITLVGMDDENKLRRIIIKFETVVCNKHTSLRFISEFYDSYDRIVEILDSEWLDELKRIDQEAFDYWYPKHYALYLADVGLFQFIARGWEVIENEGSREIK